VRFTHTLPSGGPPPDPRASQKVLAAAVRRAASAPRSVASPFPDRTMRRRKALEPGRGQVYVGTSASPLGWCTSPKSRPVRCCAASWTTCTSSPCYSLLSTPVDAPVEKQLAPEAADDLWQAVSRLLRAQLGDATYRTWLAGIQALDLRNGVLRLSVPHQVARRRIE